MKKEVKAIIAVVLAVWILVMGIEIGSIREKKKAVSANNTTTVAESTTTTTAPATTESTTTTSIAPERTSDSVIESASSPQSGWETRRLLISTPSAFA